MARFFKDNWILVLVLLLLFIMSLPLFYFGNLLKVINQQTESLYAGSNFTEPVVGVCLNNLTEVRWLKEQNVMLDEAKSQKLIIKIKVAHNSLARQVAQINNLIAHHVKVLIITPVSRSGLDEVLTAARNLGIKIILYDELTEGPADLFLSVDYLQIGKIQATSLSEISGAGNYLVLRGPKDSYRGEVLYNGQRDIFKMAKNNKMNIITVDNLSSWSADEAVNKTRAVIAHQKIHGILAPDDLIAEEIFKFLKEQKAAIPLITGSGAELTACQRIIAGEQLVTVYFNYQMMAKTAITYAKELSLGSEPVLPNYKFFYGRRIPAKIFPVYPIMKDNLENLLVDKLKVYTVHDLNG